MGEPADHLVTCHLGELLESRAMTLAELSRLAGVSVVNLSVLKNDRAKAIRFSTLTAVCSALNCTPGELLSIRNPYPGEPIR
ncbi:putative transcriptional regulator [Rhodococcus sp. 27YEA15]|uniref:helix-turn-helix domain-containing protein n=1 Tax=Rhodococcus sp. 27YEA15 TaxID=3156259 RepID=UPI003C79C776